MDSGESKSETSVEEKEISSNSSDSDGEREKLVVENGVETPNVLELGLASELKKCFLKHNISHACINDLLGILGNYHSLPRDARTLLETPAKIEIKNVPGGKYAHFGIRAGTEERLKLNHDEKLNSLSLTFNVDGLPIFKSSTYQFWPILCIIDEFFELSPFIIGIFCGRSKPTNLNDYLNDFILDINELFENPFIGHKKFSINIRAFICDASARSFLIG